MPKFKDITKNVFGKLTVIEVSKRMKKDIYWKCICECGTVKDVRGSSLRSGSTKSCGCMMDMTKFKKKHDKSFSKEYRSWLQMKKRSSGNEARYKQYAEKGVDNEWFNSFEKFYNDMGPMPDGEYTIDRIDNDKGYYPGNCRWATTKQQNRNYSQNIKMKHNGKIMCATEWAEYFGIDRHFIYRKIKSGWSHEDIFKHLEYHKQD